MKKCHRCNTDKSLLEFWRNSKNADGLQSQCKDCQREKKKTHYLDHKDSYIEKAATWKAQQVEKIREMKRQQGCAICSETESCCLDFHHRDKDLKEFSVGQAGSWGWGKVMKEIAKCVVVCKNCHSKIHAGVLRL